MEKMGTFLDETIHITPMCVVHLHGHWNKVVLFMKLSIFADLSNGTKFIVAPVGQLMTLEAIVFHVESVTTTLGMKTWSFQVM
jgi:hypothetical protein